MRRSRLKKYSEKKTRKTIILSIIGIIIILYILFKFGIDFLVNFSLFISGSRSQSNSSTITNQINFVSAPILNPLPPATNSAEIIISGSSSKGETIYLYINNSIVDQTQTDEKGVFHFVENLGKGSNLINAKAEYKNSKSSLSDSFNVLFINSSPTLNISSPQDGESFKKDQNSVTVSGKTDPGISVTVNGFWAVIDDNNNFSYNLPLQNGDNQIKIIATDQAGNKTEKDLKVNYSQ